MATPLRVKKTPFDLISQVKITIISQREFRKGDSTLGPPLPCERQPRVIKFAHPFCTPLLHSGQYL